jgi:hypothetical protein
VIDDHIEPLTGVPLKGTGRLQDFSRPRDPRALVTILNQAYPSKSCQESICDLSSMLLDSGRVQAVLVEGYSGTLPPGYGAQFGSTIPEWINSHASVSSGVLKLFAQSGGVVFGVDDPQLLESHHDAQRQCSARANDWKDLTRRFHDALAEGKETARYTDEMRLFSRYLYPHEHEEYSLGDRALRMANVGKAMGVETTRYAALHAFVSSYEQERTLDFAQVERERTDYVNVLVHALGTWWRQPDGSVSFERRLLPPLIHWLAKTGKTQGDLEQEAARLGLTKVLAACDEGLLKILVARSLDYRAKLLSYSEYYHDILALGLRLGVDILRFPNLRRYLQYVDLAGRIPMRQLTYDLEAFAEEVVERLFISDEQREIHELDRIIWVLGRAGLLQLTPDQAENLYDDSSWRAVKQKLAKFSKSASAIRLSSWVDTVTQQAYRFCQISAARSRTMTDETVRFFSRAGIGGAILVCGGFHTSGISQLLSARHRDVAWSAVLPTMDRSDIPGDLL